MKSLPFLPSVNGAQEMEYQTMILLREKLAELLAKQEINREIIFNDLLDIQKEMLCNRADEIIALFVDAIKGLEFNHKTP